MILGFKGLSHSLPFVNDLNSHKIFLLNTFSIGVEVMCSPLTNHDILLILVQ